jgi:hypothetical protein
MIGLAVIGRAVNGLGGGPAARCAASPAGV